MPHISSTKEAKRRANKTCNAKNEGGAHNLEGPPMIKGVEGGNRTAETKEGAKRKRKQIKMQVLRQLKSCSPPKGVDVANACIAHVAEVAVKDQQKKGIKD
jgi:hypothetical protein